MLWETGSTNFEIMKTSPGLCFANRAWMQNTCRIIWQSLQVKTVTEGAVEFQLVANLSGKFLAISLETAIYEYRKAFLQYQATLEPWRVHPPLVKKKKTPVSVQIFHWSSPILGAANLQWRDEKYAHRTTILVCYDNSSLVTRFIWRNLHQSVHPNLQTRTNRVPSHGWGKNVWISLFRFEMSHLIFSIFWSKHCKWWQMFMSWSRIIW